ncbi:hypothetical protein [Bifidobacterium imperatoris]|nr:hypothetical protein [Bifidobacterium imperatoris]
MAVEEVHNQPGDGRGDDRADAKRFNGEPPQAWMPNASLYMA